MVDLGIKVIHEQGSGIDDFERHAISSVTLVSVGKRRVPIVDGYPSPDNVRSFRKKTAFGPFFGHCGIYPETGSHGLVSGLRRVIQVREPERKGYHDELNHNQATVFSWLDTRYDDLLSVIRARVIFGLPDKEPIEMMREWAYSPHPKRRMRVRVYEEHISRFRGIINHGVRGKVKVTTKPYETLSKAKPRVIGDLGPRAAMMGGFMMDFFKNAMSQVISMPFVEASFVSSPDVSSLRRVFEGVTGCASGARIYYFSDDVIGCLRCQHPSGDVVMLRFNADISSCDGSHGEVFISKIKEFMLNTVPVTWARNVEVVFEQLTLDFTMDFGEHQRVNAKTEGHPRLYSGSVLTTFLNNCAVCLASAVLSKLLEEYHALHQCFPTLTQGEEILHLAFERAGYIVKIDSRPTQVPEKLQFLKHSPAFVDHMIHPYLNLGVWFRNFGLCDEDLEGKSTVPMSERARRRNAGVVLGRMHGGKHCIRSAFESAWPPSVADKGVHTEYFCTTNDDGIHQHWIPAESLSRRYDVPPESIEHLAWVVARLRVGQYYDDPVVHAFIEEDYGIPSPGPWGGRKA